MVEEDINLYNINCVLQLNRSHACVEAMIFIFLFIYFNSISCWNDNNFANKCMEPEN